MAPPQHHVLIVSSEEFVPPGDPLKGIFDKDQALALLKAGLRVGALSVGMTMPAIPRVKQALKATFLAPRCALSQASGVSASIRGARRVRTSIDTSNGLPVARAAVGAIRFHDPLAELSRWERGARASYECYVDSFGPPDILHAHNAVPAGVFCANLAEQEGLPFVVTEHNTAFARDLVDPRLFPLVRTAYQRSAARLVVSPLLGDLLVARELLTDYRWIPDVLDETVFRGPSRPYPSRPVAFLSVGTFEAHKGQADLILAFARASAEVPDLRLELIGDGPERGNLESLVAHLRLTGGVVFSGQQPRQAVKKALDRSHAAVIASHHETFGVVAIESLACGRPVIATRCGGPEAVIDDMNGVLVGVGKVDELSAALVKMAGSYKRFDPATLSKFALEQFGRTALADRLTAVYDEILN